MKVWMIIYKIEKIEAIEILSGTVNTSNRYKVLEIDKVFLTHGIELDEQPKTKDTIYIENGQELELNEAYEYVIKAIFKNKFNDLSLGFQT